MTGTTIHVRKKTRKMIEDHKAPGQSYDGFIREILGGEEERSSQYD